MAKNILYYKIWFFFIKFCFVDSKMLKNLECGLFDAEFSVIKKNHRFNNDIIKTNQNQEVQECFDDIVVETMIFFNDRKFGII